jgi:hypothetical protein
MDPQGTLCHSHKTKSDGKGLKFLAFAAIPARRTLLDIRIAPNRLKTGVLYNSYNGMGELRDVPTVKRRRLKEDRAGWPKLGCERLLPVQLCRQYHELLWVGAVLANARDRLSPQARVRTAMKQSDQMAQDIV